MKYRLFIWKSSSFAADFSRTRGKNNLFRSTPENVLNVIVQKCADLVVDRLFSKLHKKKSVWNIALPVIITCYIITVVFYLLKVCLRSVVKDTLPALALLSHPSAANCLIVMKSPINDRLSYKWLTFNPTASIMCQIDIFPQFYCAWLTAMSFGSLELLISELSDGNPALSIEFLRIQHHFQSHLESLNNLRRVPKMFGCRR